MGRGINVFQLCNLKTIISGWDKKLYGLSANEHYHPLPGGKKLYVYPKD